MREIDRRVRYLRHCLLDLQAVDYDEIFNRTDYISIDAPMARALIKKEVGDEAMVPTPSGHSYWTILEIEYVTANP